MELCRRSKSSWCPAIRAQTSSLFHPVSYLLPQNLTTEVKALLRSVPAGFFISVCFYFFFSFVKTMWNAKFGHKSKEYLSCALKLGIHLKCGLRFKGMQSHVTWNSNKRLLEPLRVETKTFHIASLTHKANALLVFKSKAHMDIVSWSDQRDELNTSLKIDGSINLGSVTSNRLKHQLP